MAGVATRAIDCLAYGGRNLRKEVAALMATEYPVGTSLLEVGCGTGTLTRELEQLHHFDLTAVDTSCAMLDVAVRKNARTMFFHANGANFAWQSDLSIACMVMHELPSQAHSDLLVPLMHQTKGDVWIVDIDPAYRPSKMMLTGEPYLSNYLVHFEQTIRNESTAAGRRVQSIAFIPSRVRVWILKIE